MVTDGSLRAASRDSVTNFGYTERTGELDFQRGACEGNGFAGYTYLDDHSSHSLLANGTAAVAKTGPLMSPMPKL